MCMIQRWRDETPTEKRFYDENPGGDPYYIIEALPRVEGRSVEPHMDHALRLHLKRGRVVVVKALVRNYESWRATAYPQLRSPHGTMTSGHHVVVLISDTNYGYRLLDPFYRGDAQPLEVADEAFTSWFVGHAFIASR